MANIIGIVGFKGSGKDTIGDHLVLNRGFSHDSFAAPLKDAVAAVFSWPRVMLEGSTKISRKWREEPDEWWEARLDWKNNPASKIYPRFTPRVALQLWGTEVCRTGFHNDIWIASLERRLQGRDNVVVTDCRFPNEFTAIRQLGGQIWRVRRGPEPEWYSTAEIANSDNPNRALAIEEMHNTGVHTSEWAWIGQHFDEVIENDSTLEDLYSVVDKLLD